MQFTYRLDRDPGRFVRSPESIRKIIRGRVSIGGIPERGTWLEPIMRGMREHRVRLERRPVDQPVRDSVVFEVEDGGRCHSVVIDHGDHVDVSEAGAEQALLYFKLNFAVDGYPQTVLPGGYMPASDAIYRRLFLLRALRGKPRFSFDVYGRWGNLQGARPHSLASRQ